MEWRSPNVAAGVGREDPCPELTLGFTVNNSADYTSTNNLNRASGLARPLLSQGLKDLPGLGEVMLNEIRLQGEFTSSGNRKATIDGSTLMFVKDLAGKAPTLRLDANQAAGPRTYTFNVDLNMYLYHDFEIVGDGNAKFRIGGAMSGFDPVSGVRKRGRARSRSAATTSLPAS